MFNIKQAGGFDSDSCVVFKSDRPKSVVTVPEHRQSSLASLCGVSSSWSNSLSRAFSPAARALD